MKKTVITSLIILTGWALLAIIQLWLTPMEALTFVKISATAAVLEVVILIAGLARREYYEEQSLKKNSFLDE
ncbi:MULTISPECIES: hypothetical protein [Klebsiella]|uniref:hypothetical protein n=1 Tax=Klebsiella TaxID=570 RepID=UPI000B41CBBF|nr:MULTISPECIES: hypothetical protein [Klebsiella]EKZ9669450.1 hypothetical protein [Klebsiella aerogenes]ELA2276077.1 hypothetical protein [Klebsiella aerogenes]MDA3994217.1 hypothetical protein [Klebsiella aerogenes]MDU9365825.1 hypothetical protein [Klebsiella sp. 141203]MEB7636795.1 hypothetical protein [Klebsiella aerogenes]